MVLAERPPIYSSQLNIPEHPAKRIRTVERFTPDQAPQTFEEIFEWVNKYISYSTNDTFNLKDVTTAANIPYHNSTLAKIRDRAQEIGIKTTSEKGWALEEGEFKKLTIDLLLEKPTVERDWLDTWIDEKRQQRTYSTKDVLSATNRSEDVATNRRIRETADNLGVPQTKRLALNESQFRAVAETIGPSPVKEAPDNWLDKWITEIDSTFGLEDVAKATRRSSTIPVARKIRAIAKELDIETAESKYLIMNEEQFRLVAKTLGVADPTRSEIGRSYSELRKNDKPAEIVLEANVASTTKPVEKSKRGRPRNSTPKEEKEKKPRAPRVRKSRSGDYARDPELDPNRPGLYAHIIPDTDGKMAARIEELKENYRKKYPDRKTSIFRPTQLNPEEHEKLTLTTNERREIDKTASIDLTNLYLSRLVLRLGGSNIGELIKNPTTLLGTVSVSEDKINTLINDIGTDNLLTYVFARFIQGMNIAWSENLTETDLQNRKIRSLRSHIKQLSELKCDKDKTTRLLYRHFDLPLPSNLQNPSTHI